MKSFNQFVQEAHAACEPGQLNENPLQAFKNMIGRGMLNPFGGRATVRSGAAGRQQVPVYRGRPYKGNLKISGDRPAFSTTNPQTGNTYTNPGASKGVPGTGARTNPRGTLDRGTLPQRYIDKYGGRSVLGQQQIKMSPSAAARTFGGTVNKPKPTTKPRPTRSISRGARGATGGFAARNMALPYGIGLRGSGPISPGDMMGRGGV